METKLEKEVRFLKSYAIVMTLVFGVLIVSAFTLQNRKQKFDGQTQGSVQTSRLVVSFYSICCGIDQKAKADLDKFITRYEKSKRKRLVKSTVRWGKEGEVDYCLKLSELSSKNQKTFISQVRTLLKKSKLVHINENVACQSEQ